MQPKEMVERLHAIAEEFRRQHIRPADQCTLRWAANRIALSAEGSGWGGTDIDGIFLWNLTLTN